MKRFVLLALIAVLLPTTARAQLSTPDASRQGPTITIDGKAVIEPRTMAIAGIQREETSILPEIRTVRFGDTGYDLVCTYRNTKATPASAAART